MSARFERLAELFELCSDRPPDEVAAILERECADDPELRAAVESLLARDAEPHTLGDVTELVEEVLGHPLDPGGGAGPGGAEAGPGVENRTPAGSSPPASIGRYEVSGVLGHGGMGTVYLALDRDLGRPVALKVLPESWVDQPAWRARLQAEARILARLSHPNVAVLYSLEEADGRIFLTMEAIRGETLDARLARSGPASVAEALAWGRQIASALHAAHAEGIIHRDLKPSNVMITAGNVLKVLDFGIAEVVALAEGAAAPHGTVSADTADGSVDRGRASVHRASAPGSGPGRAVLPAAGSPGYVSPEQLRGGPATIAADLWGWGAILYECLTGTMAFPGDSPGERVRATLAGPPPRERIPPNAPGALVRLIYSCLDPDPGARPPDATALQARLEAAGERPPGRHRMIVAAVSAAVLVAIFAARLFLGPIGAPRGEGSADFPAPKPTPTQVTRSGFVRDLDITADGRWIATLTSDGKLAVTEVATGAERALLTDATIQSVAWSPDQTRILVHTLGRADDGSFLVNVASGAMVPVGPRSFQGRCWSADGQRILGARSLTRFSQGPLHVLDLGSGELASVPLPEDLTHVEYDWSPAGGQLLIVGSRAHEERGLWVVPAEGGVPVRIAAGEIGRAEWAPEGDAIFLLARRGERSVVLRLPVPAHPPAGGGGLLTLVSGSGDSLGADSVGGGVAESAIGVTVLELPPSTLAIRVSADGSRLAFLDHQPRSTLWRLAAPDFAPQAVWGGTFLLTDPKLRPGSEEIAVVMGTSEAMSIHLLSPSGNAPGAITQVGASKSFLSWSADGTRLAFGTERNGTEEVWWMSVPGGTPQPVPGIRGRTFLRWVPDGRILVHPYGADNRNYALVTPESGAWHWLFDPPRDGTLFQVAPSPDGRRYALAGARGERGEFGVWIVTPESSEEHLLYAGTAVPVSWSRDGRWVHLAREVRESRYLGESVGEVLRVRVDDGHVEALAALPPGDLRRWTDVDVAPDGDVVVCALGQDQRDVWVVELPPRAGATRD